MSPSFRRIILSLRNQVCHMANVNFFALNFRFLVESVSAVTEENNKKNATNEGSEQRNLIETDLNFSVPNLSSTDKPSLNVLTTAQSSPNINLSTPISINLAEIPVIDDESNTSNQQQQQQQTKKSDDTSSSEDDEEDEENEQTQLKRLKANNEQIEAPVEEEEEEEVRRFRMTYTNNSDVFSLGGGRI